MVACVIIGLPHILKILSKFTFCLLSFAATELLGEEKVLFLVITCLMMQLPASDPWQVPGVPSSPLYETDLTPQVTLWPEYPAANIIFPSVFRISWWN